MICSRPTHLGVLGLALATAALLVSPRLAEACSCVANQTDFLAPADGATDVPTNARIWVGGLHLNDDSVSAESLAEAQPFVLQRDGGETVELSPSVVWGNNELIAVFTPTSELVEGAEYSLAQQVYTLDDPDPSLVSLTTFTVGSPADLEAPAIPTELDRTASASERIPGMSNSCGPDDLVTLSLEPTGQLLVARVDEAGNFDPETLDGSVSELSADGQLNLGVGGCRWSWPDAEPGARAEVQWGALDLAGNFSGWAEASAITIPPSGCSCSTSASAAGPGLPAALAVLLLGGLARRWRPRGGRL